MRVFSTVLLVILKVCFSKFQYGVFHCICAVQRCKVNEVRFDSDNTPYQVLTRVCMGLIIGIKACNVLNEIYAFTLSH